MWLRDTVIDLLILILILGDIFYEFIGQGHHLRIYKVITINKIHEKKI